MYLYSIHVELQREGRGSRRIAVVDGCEVNEKGVAGQQWSVVRTSTCNLRNHQLICPTRRLIGSQIRQRGRRGRWCRGWSAPNSDAVKERCKIHAAVVVGHVESRKIFTGYIVGVRDHGA